MVTNFFRLLIAITLISLTSAKVLAQDQSTPPSEATSSNQTNPDSSQDEETNFWDRFHIRHNLNSKEEVAQPAFFQITLPDSGDVTAVINAGVKVDAIDRELLTVGPFLEYLRNTASDKEQNTLRVGADAEWQLQAFNDDGSGWSPVLLTQLNYKIDDVKETESIQLVADLTAVFSASSAFPLPNTYVLVGPLEFVYAPYVGISAEHISAAETEGAEGTIGRFTPKLDLVLYPWGVQLERRIELSAAYQYSVDFTDDTTEDDDNHPFFQAKASYFLFKNDDRAAGVSIAFVTGEDPSKGFIDQQLWQVGLTLRVK